MAGLAGPRRAAEQRVSLSRWRGPLGLVAMGCLVAAIFVIPSAWNWLTAWDSPLRQGDVHRVENWAPQILLASAEAKLEDPFLLAGLVFAESRGLPEAVSSVDAGGLCQLMPATAAELGMRYQVEGPPFQPVDNLRLGAHYLAEQIRHRKGDVDLALLSYRLGPTRVSRELKAAGGREAFLHALRNRPGSAWGYRVQVVIMRDRFKARALDGQPAWAQWRSKG
jgi:soluble lytic murein transglycosylase-like protein